jgi:hypothetical protein
MGWGRFNKPYLNVSLKKGGGGGGEREREREREGKWFEIYQFYPYDVNL